MNKIDWQKHIPFLWFFQAVGISRTIIYLVTCILFALSPWSYWLILVVTFILFDAVWVFGRKINAMTDEERAVEHAYEVLRDFRATHQEAERAEAVEEASDGN